MKSPFSKIRMKFQSSPSLWSWSSWVLMSLIISSLVSMADSWIWTMASSAAQVKYSPRLYNSGELGQFSSNVDTQWGHFTRALDKVLVPRVPGTSTHLQVNDFIQKEMMELGWKVEEDSFSSNTPYGSKPYRNIIATLNEGACNRLVVACHYDSKYFPGKEFIGAIDSAVPCAMMLYLSRVLHHLLQQQKIKHPLSTGLQFIFFDGEEAWKDWTSTDSLYGSRHLANKWNQTPVDVPSSCPNRKDYASELDRIDLFMLLDLIGTSDCSFQSFFHQTNPHYSRLIQIESDLHKNGLIQRSGSPYFRNRMAFGGIEDDHIPFLRKGVKILHLIPSPFPSVWHQLSDNRKSLHFPTIKNLMRIITIFVSEYLHLEPAHFDHVSG